MLHISTFYAVSAHRTPISPSIFASSPSFFDTLATTSTQTLAVPTLLGHTRSRIASVSHHLSHRQSQLSFRISVIRQSTPLFPLSSLNFTTRCSTHSKELGKRFFASKLPWTRSLSQKSFVAIAYSSTELHQVSFRQISDLLLSTQVQRILPSVSIADTEKPFRFQTDKIQRSHLQLTALPYLS